MFGYGSEKQPLLENSEAFQRSLRDRRKKQLVLLFALIGVGILAILAIVIPLKYVWHRGYQPLDTPINENGTKQSYTVETFYYFYETWFEEDSNTMESDHECLKPPMLANYNSAAIYGEWYELFKIETPGNAVLQEGCRCSKMEIRKSEQGSETEAIMLQECRDARLYGAMAGAVATMAEQRRDGFWKQNLFGVESNWFVILQQHSYMLTYDCSSSFEGNLEYGIHLYVRNPKLDVTMPSAKLHALLHIHGSDLNSFGYSAVMVEQRFCSDPENKEENEEASTSKNIPYLKV